MPVSCILLSEISGSEYFSRKAILMKIVFTGDVHLRSTQLHPERYNALRNILSRMIENNINHIVIAGDLFDQNINDPSEFEAICRNPEYRDIQFIVIPGNHDPAINNSTVVSDNLRVISSPELHMIDPDGPAFLFLPFESGVSMGEKISDFEEVLTGKKWILVGHGDYFHGHIEINAYEPGVYMPLTGTDIRRFKPSAVFLGHIHKALDDPPVFIVGSPCGMDITEHGRRRFLVFDTHYGKIESFTVDTDVIFFEETFILIPSDDELMRLNKQIKKRIQSWNISPEEKKKVRIRVRAKGFSSDRKKVLEALKYGFNEFVFYKDEEPDIKNLYFCDDEQRKAIAEKVLERISSVQLPAGSVIPDRDMLVEKALHVIYGKR